MHSSLSASGTRGLIARGAAGVAICFASITSSDGPPNGRRPVNASYSITPTAYQSLAGDSAPPAACSGAMYATVPYTCPWSTSDLTPVPNSVASPKSSTTTRPWPVTRTLLGLMSQCRRRRSCSVSSALTN